MKKLTAVATSKASSRCHVPFLSSGYLAEDLAVHTREVTEIKEEKLNSVINNSGI